MKLIVGLGNPGAQYAHTRHNAGWLALDRLAARLSAGAFKQKKEFQAEITEARVADAMILLVHPLTFMNRAGECVQLLLSYYHLSVDDLLVVQDEMDFPLGRLGFLAQGGAAGHNGIHSIQRSLSTTAFARLRLGIGRPVPPMAKEDYVLQAVSAEEFTNLNVSLERATDAMRDWIELGTAAAMNIWNASAT